MGRTKLFDQETALEAALLLFWQQGYAATSMQNLTDAMGIYRKSLYDTYGDKDSLYLACLNRYGAHLLAELRARTAAQDSLKKKLRAIFDYSLSAGDKGCFLVNTAVELSTLNPDIKAWVQAADAKTTSLLSDLLIEAQANGELSPECSVSDLAATLANAWTGLRVTLKFERDPARLNTIIEQNLRLLED